MRPTTLDLTEQEARIAMLRADTELKREQARWEPWKVIATAVAATTGLLAAFAALLTLVYKAVGIIP